jgi:hypothetical protein
MVESVLGARVLQKQVERQQTRAVSSEEVSTRDSKEQFGNQTRAATVECDSGGSSHHPTSGRRLKQAGRGGSGTSLCATYKDKYKVGGGIMKAKGWWKCRLVGWRWLQNCARDPSRLWTGEDAENQGGCP